MRDLPADYFPFEIAAELKNEAEADVFFSVLERPGEGVQVEEGLSRTQALIQARSEAALRKLVARLEAAIESGVHVSQAQVVYCEWLGCAAEIDFTHKAQAARTGAFARVKLQFEPLHERAGFVFESRIVGGAVPEEFVPAVEKGLAAARQNGLLVGYPVIDFRAVLVDGAYHDLDSNELAFEIAARGAFRQLKDLADPRLVQPVVEIIVAVPGHLVDKVRSALGARGLAEIVLITREAGAALHFHGPLGRALGLEQELADRTGGAADVQFRFAGMQEVPRPPAAGGDDNFPPAIGMRA